MTDRFTLMWSEKQHQKWAKVRQKGRWRFILLNGILGWGVTMFVVMTGMRVCFSFPAPVVATPLYLISNATIWTLGGFLFGLLTWAFSEKLFMRADSAHTIEIGGN